jgi:hypothetical protein
VLGYVGLLLTPWLGRLVNLAEKRPLLGTMRK